MDFNLYKNTVDQLDSLAWTKKECEVLELFKFDALTETGLLGHPKASEIWVLAWKNGHEGGFEEVFFHLNDLANMFF